MRPLMGRRFLALLILVAMGPAQWQALVCPMDSVSRASEETVSGMAHTHFGHGSGDDGAEVPHQHRSVTEQPETAPDQPMHAGAACAASTLCSPVVPSLGVWGVAGVPMGTTPENGGYLERLLSAFPSQLTPPPRLTA